MAALEEDMDIHLGITHRGIFLDVVVATALVDVYAKCGSLDMARELFDTVPKRDGILWNAMIAGYAQSGFVEKASETLEQIITYNYKHYELNPKS